MHRSLRQSRECSRLATLKVVSRDGAFQDEKSSGSPNSEQSRILYVTSEMTDFVKVGGLGDVSSALPRALRRYHDVRVLIPGYREILKQHTEMPVVARLPAASGLPACDLGRLEMLDGLVVYVILCPELFDRDGSPYGDTSGVDWLDNDVRFARLGLAAAELAAGSRDLDWRPDLLHLNDWPSALAAAFLNWRNIPTPTILTIHNLAYQGLFGAERLPVLGIPESSFRVDGVEFYGKLSFLKAGIYYASHVTTVSSTYAREITTPELGCGLDGLLRVRSSQGRLTGILNGIDGTWGPDGLPASQRPVRPSSSCDWTGKPFKAEHVRQAFGLAVSRGPLFAVVSRLVHQKGIDLTIQATETILREGGQLVITGRGEARFEMALQELAFRHPGHVGVRIGFEEAEARQMFAGSDFLLMPSRFEPCGLSQMYAQSFGTLPVASKTGGLADTVEDGVTGFLFEESSLAEMLGALYRAVDIYASPQKLKAMRRAAMQRRFGWDRSARKYCGLYEGAIVRRAG
ncbi:MAG: glycogen synthase GlgA [Xanthobacteraceae bacterium]|nr:glycogen synthase GlgA [Xanthobacteraceae bacterium]